MKRLASIWTIYLLSLIVMVAVMSWVTYSTLDLEQEERTTTLRAENERLALWRMESALLPLILEESSRDLDQWWLPESITLPPLPYSDGTVSELATFSSPFVALHFQVDSNGHFVSPQVPGETLTSELLALDQITPEQLAERQALFKDLKATTTSRQLFDAMQKFQPNVARFGPPELLADQALVAPKSDVSVNGSSDTPRLSSSIVADSAPDSSHVQSSVNSAPGMNDPFNSSDLIVEPVVTQTTSRLGDKYFEGNDLEDNDVVQQLFDSYSREANRRIPLQPTLDDLRVPLHSLVASLGSIRQGVEKPQTPLQVPNRLPRTTLFRGPQNPNRQLNVQEHRLPNENLESKQLDRFQQQAAKPGATYATTNPSFDQQDQGPSIGVANSIERNSQAEQSLVPQPVAGNQPNPPLESSTRTTTVARPDLEPRQQLEKRRPAYGQSSPFGARNPAELSDTNIAQRPSHEQTNQRLLLPASQSGSQQNDRPAQPQSAEVPQGQAKPQVLKQSFAGKIGEDQSQNAPGSSINLPGMRTRRPLSQNANRPFNPLANPPANSDLFHLNNGAKGKAILENVHNYALNEYNRGKGGKAKTNKIAQQQATKSVTELQQRMNNSVGRNGNFVSRFVSDNNNDVIPFSIPSIDGGVAIGPMTSFWLNGRLFLARKVVSREGEFVQGCILHWPAINDWLKSTVVDLLPNAKLSATPALVIPNHLSLATLPVQLLPGEIAVQPMPFLSPIRSSLAMAWVWLSLSAAAIGVLLYGVVRLSERRAAFVSAVTHELRTPLTTFQLYADLLSNREMLSDEKHEQYVGTLRNESERLGHLVENVLSWSRLERKNDKEANVVATWSDIISHMRRTLHDRASQASMILRLTPDPVSLESDTDSVATKPEIRFIANPSAVEQILFNLVDNACKYGRPTNDPTIEIHASVENSHACIRVTDHGPGIGSDVRKRLFQPFSKSASDAAKSEPGVGLGLSLCKRLAQNMKGELLLASSTSEGTVFELRLRLSE